MLAVLEHIAEYALLVHNHCIHDSSADHLSPPAHGTSHLGLWSQVGGDLGFSAGLSNPGEVNGGTAYAADVDLVPEIVLLGVDHGLCACCQVVAVSDENALILIQGAHADLHQGCIGSASGHIVSHRLQHVADLLAQGVDHAAVQRLGLEVHIMAFLTGVTGSQELHDLLFAILQGLAEVLERLGLFAQDGAIKGSIHQDLAAHIEGHISEFVQTPVVKVPAVSSMGAGSH
ncbi:MAG: hypothetical protein A4E43_01318 [Methanosaeta sp. PtaB.Bin005]|nr:MAG: hypothetical protein A4E43_01318 [Methanosaeta sp. PtaB.Bin005]